MISKTRMDKLKEHLELLEKKTGGKLREKPRYGMSTCPIGNFAPNENIDGQPFDGVGYSGDVYYGDVASWIGYHIYSSDDGRWWVRLTYRTCSQVTKQIIQWIKER